MQTKMVKEGMTTIINHNVAVINNVAAISSVVATSSVAVTSSKVVAIVSKAVTNKVAAISSKVATRNANNANKVHAHKCALCHVLSQ